MAFMDYMPQFGNNTAPMQETALPADDTAMQMELKRRLKMAEALQQQELPQGQMVSGHYVAPSWTQYLASGINAYQGNKKEKEALNQFGEYQKAKQAKLADLLAGKEVTAPVDYNEAGNMPGMMQTTRQPYNQQEFMAKAISAMPELAPQLIQNQMSQYGKEEAPIIASPGSVGFNRKGEKLFEVPNKPDRTVLSNIGKLTEEMNMLSENDPRRETYKAAIAKETNIPLQAPIVRNMRQGSNEVTQQFNPNTQTWSTIASGPAFKPEAPVDRTSVENTASMIASGQIQPLSGFAMKTPWGQQVMSRVKDMNPDFSGASFGNQKKAVQDFNTGKLGSTVRSLNVATSHLDTLGGLADALGTGNVQLLNKAANAWKSQTGQVAPVNFDAAKKIVADEVVKAVVGSGGGVADREEAARTIQSANSPAQLRGVINTYKDLMHGQLNGLRQQYEQSTNLKDFDKYLSPSIKPQGAPSAARSQADAILGL